MIVSSTTRSNSSDNTLTISTKTPLCVHRRNRLKTLFHGPKRGGRSRHDDPVRNRQKTASRNRRLSAAVLPGSTALPGHSGATRSYISSVKTVRSVFILSPALSAPAAFSTCDMDKNIHQSPHKQDDCQRTLTHLERCVHLRQSIRRKMGMIPLWLGLDHD